MAFNRKYRFVFLLIALFFEQYSFAHHSRSNFDLTSTIVIKGSIVEWRYRNPHAFLKLQSLENGEPVTWAVELGSIPNLKQMGLDRDSVKIGDEIELIANPEKNPKKNYLFFKSMIINEKNTFSFADVFAYSDSAKAKGKEKPGSSDFTGKWDEEISRNTILLGSGLPPFNVTKLGADIIASYDPSEEPSFYCEPVGLPSMIGTPYAIEITKDRNNYKIRHEFPGTTRTVHMNKENLPDRDNPDVYGHSIGEIIDGKLIIETDNFIPTKWGIGQGLDSSSSKHVTEVYSLKEDGHILEIVYTVSDPVYLKEPFSKTHIKRIVPDYKLTEYEECDPEFAKMHLLYENQ